jgi:hypothetical protein
LYRYSVVDISAEGGVDGASSPINWLTVTLDTGDALNLTVPCRDAGRGVIFATRILCRLNQTNKPRTHQAITLTSNQATNQPTVCISFRD